MIGRGWPIALGRLVLAGLAIGGPTACEDGRSSFDLDGLVEPERECVEIVHEALELGGPIYAFASDTPGSRGGWALVSTIVQGDSVLAMIRVPANADEPPTEALVVALDPFDAPLFQLRAGLELGTAWLLREGAPVTLRKLAPGVGLEAINTELDNFPVDESGADCPDQWWRQLLLISGRPFMLALPDCSEGPDVEMQLLELDEHTLGFLTNWTLAFDPCQGLDPAACASAYAFRLEAIGTGQSTHLPGASRVGVGFTQVRAFDGVGSEAPIALSSDVSLLDLRVDASGPDARLLTFREVWLHATPFPLGAVQLGQDREATQLFVPNLADRSESALFRLETISDALTPTTSEALPFSGAGTLVQLDRESAMLHLDTKTGRLEATSLADVGTWGAFTSQVVHEEADVIGFASAGPGMLLIQRSEHPDQLLHLGCMP